MGDMEFRPWGPGTGQVAPGQGHLELGHQEQSGVLIYPRCATPGGTSSELAQCLIGEMGVTVPPTDTAVDDDSDSLLSTCWVCGRLGSEGIL